MAARKNPLRAVTDADMPDKPPKVKSITEAAEDGDTLSELKAMRVLLSLIHI